MTHISAKLKTMPSEQLLDIKVSPKEAAVIKFIRDNKFGKVIVYMSNGAVSRLETTQSYKIEENDGLMFLSQFAGQTKDK